MSFHSELIAVWPADLVSALSLSANGQVYAGRRPQGVTRADFEIWVERLPIEHVGQGFQQVTRHPYLLHLREFRGNQGNDKTGNLALTVLEAHMQTVIERYHGAIPSFVSGINDVMAVEAVEAEVDEDEEDNVMSGSVRVVWTLAAGADT